MNKKIMLVLVIFSVLLFTSCSNSTKIDETLPQYTNVDLVECNEGFYKPTQKMINDFSLTDETIVAVQISKNEKGNCLSYIKTYTGKDKDMTRINNHAKYLRKCSSYLKDVKSYNLDAGIEHFSGEEQKMLYYLGDTLVKMLAEDNFIPEMFTNESIRTIYSVPQEIQKYYETKDSSTTWTLEHTYYKQDGAWFGRVTDMYYFTNVEPNLDEELAQYLIQTC